VRPASVIIGAMSESPSTEDRPEASSRQLTPRVQLAGEVGVVGLALAVRLVALSAFETTPFSEFPMVDAHTYWAQATALFDGKDPFAEGYYQPPAYPFLLSKVGGLMGEMALSWVRRLHLLFGVATTAGIVVLGRRLGARLGLGWAGIAAGAVFALGAPPVLFEHDVLTPAFTLAVSTWGLVAVSSGRAWATALGGLLFGCAVAAHPTYLLAAGVLALGLVLLARKGSGWGPVIGFCTALSVPILPTTIDNHRQFGVVAPVSLNGGVNLYLGNNPRMRQTAFLRPGLPFRQLILDADPATRNQAERDRYWRQRTRAEIAESPVAWLAVMGVKALWSVNDAEIPRNEDYRCRTRAGQPLAWMGRLPVRFGLLFPFAVLGAVVAVRHRNTLGEWTVLPALWLALHAPLVLFLVSDRYRLATWPVVVLLAVLGAWGLKERVLGRKASLGLLAGLGVLSLLPIDSRTAMDPAWCTYQEANLAYMQKDYPAAQEGYEAVVSHAGWEDDMGAHYWLGRLADLRKDRPAAMRHYDVVLQSYDDHYPTLVARADAAYYDGRKGEAADYLLRAYRVPGPRTSTGVKLVKLLRRLGREDEAEALMAADPKLANHPKLQ